MAHLATELGCDRNLGAEYVVLLSTARKHGFMALVHTQHVFGFPFFFASLLVVLGMAHSSYYV